MIAGAIVVVLGNRERTTAPWPPRSVAASRAAVARDPLDPTTLRNLGLALDRAGDAAGADRLMTLAWERTRRDTPTTAWLLVRRLAQGRYPEALATADALVRRDPDDRTRERLFQLLIAAAHYDVSRPALIARLAEAPWWRPAFMREFVATADPADSHAVVAGLAATANPPTPPELDAYLTRLVAGHAYADAARDWRAFSRPRRDPDAIGDLDAPPPFGWSPAFGEGASSAVEDGALRVDYDGYGAARLPVRSLALSPGRYTVTWRERASGDDIGRIAVNIGCGEAATMLASTAPTQRRLDFEVPTNGCEGQTLAITALPGERRASMTALFDRWSLGRR